MARTFKQRIVIFLKRAFLARTSFEQHLYPPLEWPIVFRPYSSADFDACVEIYRRNEAGRFPEGHLPRFTSFLETSNKALIVAECDSRVVAYGGVSRMAADLIVLCYGIVDPAFQGRRIGTTLTLLRVANFPASPAGAWAMINAVDASITFYRRFGFLDGQNWRDDHGTEHPSASVHIPDESRRKISRILKGRGVEVKGGLTLPAPAFDMHLLELTHSGTVRLDPKAAKEYDAAVLARQNSAQKPTGND